MIVGITVSYKNRKKRKKTRVNHIVKVKEERK